MTCKGQSIEAYLKLPNMNHKLQHFLNNSFINFMRLYGQSPNLPTTISN